MGDNRGQLVVVTGMTGAGRSTAAKELEDLGFFVVDNLPPQLVPDVVRLVDESQGPLQPIAVVVDVRSGSFFASQVSSRIMVSPFAAEYLGQFGSPRPFGLPVFMNCSRAPAIFSDSALGLGPPPV